jgi:predicted dehydrogenase
VSLVETVITHRIRGSNRTFEAFGSDASAELVPVSNEDVAFAIFRMSEGLVGQLTVSQVSAGRKNKLRVEIDGSEAGAIFDTEHPELLWISRSERSELLMRNGPALSPDAQRFSTLPAGHAQGFVDCFVGLFSDFYSTILGEQPPRHPTFEDGRRVATIADSVLASAANHSWVKVEP